MCEMPKCLTEATPKARKRHRCCECNGWIEPGETYHRYTGVWDDPATYKVCRDCEALRAKLDEGAPYDERTPFTGLSETASEGGGDALLEFLAIMRRRGTSVHPSWERAEAELIGATTTAPP